MICDITTAELLEIIASLKSIHGRIITNSFRNFSAAKDKIWRVIYNSNALFILVLDNTIVRIEFFASDIYDLRALIDDLPPGDYDMEYIYRKQNDYLASFSDLGFELYKTMQRYCNYDIGASFAECKEQIGVKIPFKEYLVLDKGQYFCIKQLLWDTFDTRISHLPSDEELSLFIENGEFLGIFYENRLTTLLQRKLDNNRFYINQVINYAEPAYIHSIMIGELEKYILSGGKYVYSWIENDNIASIKFHKKYGLKPDLIMNDNMILRK